MRGSCEGGAAARGVRGVSLSAFVAVAVLALILVAGLVVDGGQQAAAHRRAESVAARAARAATDASAPYRLLGADGSVQALAAARNVLAGAEGIDGRADVLAGGRLEVTTSVRFSTVFLSVIGIDSLEASGEAVAELQQK